MFYFISTTMEIFYAHSDLIMWSCIVGKSSIVKIEKAKKTNHSYPVLLWDGRKVLDLKSAAT